MVNPDVLLPRFKKLSEYLSVLQRLSGYTKNEFLADPEHYGSCERFLQLSIETLNDIGNHIIADDALGTVEWYSDIPNSLAEHGVISEQQKETWIQMIGFRNILVHDYISIDRERVYDVLHNNLEDIDKLKSTLAAQLSE